MPYRNAVGPPSRSWNIQRNIWTTLNDLLPLHPDPRKVMVCEQLMFVVIKLLTGDSVTLVSPHP